MIEAIKEIGEKVLSNAPEQFLESLARPVSVQNQNNKQYILIIEFDTTKGTINFELEEIKEETPRKYLWIGNASANNLQDRFTTTNLEYLVSQTIPNFKLFQLNEELGNVFEKLKDKFYYDVGPQEGQRERYRYVWNIEKLGISSKTMEQLIEEAKGNIKKLPKIISNEIFAYLKKEKNWTKKDIALFTIKVDGQFLVNLPEYRTYIENSIVSNLFSEGETGICHLCQEEKEITNDTSKLKFKYYITDKIGFSSGLQREGFFKNFSLCKDCYKKLLAGESFIENNLRSYLAGTNLYIIPKFIFDISYSIEGLKRWANYINISLVSTVSLEGLRKFKEQIEDYPDFEEQKNNFILNLLFYRKAQSEFKVLKLIKDVPPSRLDILREEESEIHDIGVRVFGENSRWYLGLGKMYYLFPVRKSKQEVVDYKKVLEFYDSLFSGRVIPYKFLIRQFVELACVYRFEKFDNYNIGKPDDTDIGLVYAMLEANLILVYLKKLNLLKEGDNMEVDKTDLEGEIKEYVKEMGYSKPKTAVFLLGYLIGEVANAQYKKGGTKPILNKITYQGMNVGKIMRLANEIFEKLKQYDKLSSYNEKIFAEMKKLLDKHIENWEISDQENVFYVLSGYAYNTYRAIKSKKDENKNNEVAKNE
ncbi:MAG: hypothetical protein DRP84_10335 [Spirochaetes bacterium]|nr:MAG: hypothetical protein DRP84_10335 [Spirochaetota bacterium]